MRNTVIVPSSNRQVIRNALFGCSAELRDPLEGFLYAAGGKPRDLQTFSVRQQLRTFHEETRVLA